MFRRIDINGRSVNVTDCCDRMIAQHRPCADHDDPFECPDALMATFRDGTVGIVVHDGGTSIVQIKYCPWCGTNFDPITS